MVSISRCAHSKKIEATISSEFSPEMHNKIMEATRRCAGTAQEIWKEGNEENEELLDSIPDLSERKTGAGKRCNAFTRWLAK